MEAMTNQVKFHYKTPPKPASEITSDEALGREKVKKQSQFGEVMKRLFKNRSAVIGLVIIAIFVFAAIFAPLIAPYDYEAVDISNMYASPSLEHLCGTDEFGRDIFSRLVYGARYSLALGLCAEAFSVVFGIVVGGIAGYFGGWVDNLIMRLLDIIQAIPSILLSIVISTALGGGFFNTVLAMGVGGIARGVRTIRAQFLQVREQEYVEAAKAIDCSTPKIIFTHILPNAVAPMIVSTTMGIGGTIMGAAGLSYLGLGIQPPTPEWGAMLTAAKDSMRTHPLQMLWPGLCIAIFVLAMNMFGDALRDAMDPKLKN